MLQRLTRGKLIAVWFIVVAAVWALVVLLGVSVSTSTAMLLIVGSIVPPVVLMALWRGEAQPTMAELMHDGDGSPKNTR
jgi:hypothetical protein